ncbi:MAG: dCTP deaminase domain-containing protein [Candidatus Thorarchaeota archaeon]
MQNEKAVIDKEEVMSNEIGRINHHWLLCNSEISKVISSDGIIRPPESGKDLDRWKKAIVDSGTAVLHVGKVLRPKATSDIYLPKSVMESSDIVVVNTLEKICMPENCTGIVFGTNSTTNRGLLLINPGIITTGHGGNGAAPIELFLVNISRTSFELSKGAPIARLMLFRYPENNSTGEYSLTRPCTKKGNTIDYFTAHFHETIGKQVAEEASKKVWQTSLRIFLGLIVVGILFTLAVHYVGQYNIEKISALDSKFRVQEQVADLKSRLLLLENTAPTRSKAPQQEEANRRLIWKRGYVHGRTDSPTP